MTGNAQSLVKQSTTYCIRNLNLFLKPSYVVDGAWTAWSNSSSCSVTCGNGSIWHLRHCANPEPRGSGASCSGPSELSTPCNYGPCPPKGKFGKNDSSFSLCFNEMSSVDGAWTDWMDLSPCSVNCGDGTKEQGRFCSDPAPQGCGADCSGPSHREVSCSFSACTNSGRIE